MSDFFPRHVKPAVDFEGLYYIITLCRESGRQCEWAEIGVGTHGEIVSYMQNRQLIRQYDRLDAEAFVKQMTMFDPPWGIENRRAPTSR